MTIKCNNIIYDEIVKVKIEKIEKIEKFAKKLFFLPNLQQQW